MVYIHLPGLPVGLAKPHWPSMYNTGKKGYKVLCDLNTFFHSILWLTHFILKIFRLKYCHIYLPKKYLGWTVGSGTVKRACVYFLRILISPSFGGLNVWTNSSPRAVDKMCASHSIYNQAFHLINKFYFVLVSQTTKFYSSYMYLRGRTFCQPC